MSSLVIVESPAKAKTLSRILGDGYVVEASYGHVRDLPESADQIPAAVKGEPWAQLGVNVESDFEPVYVIPNDKKKHIQRLKKALAGADELLLATDEDREGESISWHVFELLNPKVETRRIVFHEITDEAIFEALRNPRELDSNLVRAQESRRILDRLFGYELSPVLWRKVRRGLSAGRVQSVAVRLCVIRERERKRFVPSTYWDVEARFDHPEGSFAATLIRLGGRRLATGKDFDPASGQLKGRSPALWLESRRQTDSAIAGWSRPWQVTSVEEKPQKRRAAPPFTTSSLQQEANRKLRFSARHTMRVAQRLYEGVEAGGDRVGLITYMRTDSVTLSKKALADAQRVIRERYGAEFTDGPRQYRTKSKMAQEAHEAIRPTEISRTPERVKPYLSADELKLYELIWRRTLASQMADARLRRTSVEITAPGDGGEGIFSATGTSIEFPGFLRAYVEGSDDPAADLADREVILPTLAKGESLDPETVEAKSHETTPPARYTEASLVKKLESEGIGRPSTYAAIIDTIQNRGYIFKQSNALVPTFTACAVTQLLEEHFADYVDIGFTARMEEQLDEIASGSLEWKAHLRDFYFSEDPDSPGLERRIAEEAPRIEYPAVEIGAHPLGGEPIVVRIGRYGPYLQLQRENGEALTASISEETPPADLSVDKALELLEKNARGPRRLGSDPETDEPVLLAEGRYGPYVQLGENGNGPREAKPKRASVPKGVDLEDVGLEEALKWLSLPRSLGTDPDSGEEIVATSGRFGPFVKRGKETRSLAADDDVYSIDLDRARELLAEPKGRRGRSGGVRSVLKELGKTEEGAKLQLVDGRYGPYLTDGEMNASIPKGTDPEALDAEAAQRIFAERRKPPKRRRASKKQ